MRAVIFVWAELAALPVEIKKDDFIICADVGLKTAERFGVRPSVVIGDFDSYPNGRLYNGEKVVLPVEKDDTDTHYAVRYALDRGADEIVIVGGIGGAREDHTFANIATLRYIYSRGAKGYIITDRARIDYLENGTLTFPAEEKSVNVTVFPLTETALVTERGLKYSVEKTEFFADVPLWASNSTLPGTEATITVHAGKVVIFRIK